MTGWLGAAYNWVLAAHIIFVIFWMAGLFIFSRHLAYMAACPPGSAEEGQWTGRIRLLRSVILTPSLLAVWVLGLMLAFSYGFAGQAWLHAKIAFVVLLTAFHMALVPLSRRMGQGERPRSETFFRRIGEIPAVLTVIIVILVVVKPF
jgi:putative membrane protein